MPLLKFSRVLSFTSEDPNHPADNLLSLHTYRKWKIAQSECGKQASVTLMLEKLSTITALDIGNDGSAFVEVLVARDDDDFQVLLPTSSFMSPLEARNGTDTNRVRMFTSRHLNKNIAAQKWTRVKFVCSQPFNKHSPFGLTFVALTSDEQTPTQKDSEADSSSSTSNLLQEPACDDTSQQPNISIGSFFAKRRKLDSNQNETAKENNSSSNNDNSNNSDKSSSKNGKNNNGSSRSSNAPASEAAAANVQIQSSNHRPREERSASQKTHPTKSPVPHRSSQDQNRANTSAVKERVSLPKASSATPSGGGRACPTPDPQSRKNCLRGVIYSMSGYQNPQRSQLRDKMTAMGASYRPDWSDDCTHLICAFTNTPKYRTVQGKGRIVGHRWVEECYLFKKKMPWEKYRLDKGGGSPPASPAATPNAGPSSPVRSDPPHEVKDGSSRSLEQQDDENSNYDEDTDSEDTDDEIRR